MTVTLWRPVTIIDVLLMPLLPTRQPVSISVLSSARANFRMPFASLLGAVCVFPGFATHAQAQQAGVPQALPDAGRASRLLRRDQLIENQQQERLQEDQERAMRALPDPQGADLGAMSREDRQAEAQPPEEAEACGEVLRIVLTGDAERVEAGELARLREAFEGRCLGTADLHALRAELTRYFIERGEVTTRAYLPERPAEDGALAIHVIQGVIERYDVDSNREKAVWPPGVFPARPGELLNLRDLEQAVEQINRLSSNDARIGLYPGTEAGQTIVNVINRSSRPLHLYASLDNMGTKATGRNALSATLTLDSPFGFNELFALTRRQSVFPLEGGHRSDATALQAQVPYGYHALSMQWSRSTYLNTVTLPYSGRKIPIEGRTDLFSVGDDRVVYRDAMSRVTVSGRLALQSGQTWIAGHSLGVSDRDFTFLDLGIGATTRRFGGISTARFSAVRGLAMLGAYRDPAGLRDDVPHAQFQKFTMAMSHARRLQVGSRAVVLSAQFSGQYSLNTLYGSQQLLIGGPGSVRGFRDHSLGGDHGYYVRTEASLPWLVLSGANAVRGRLYAGFDWGTVINRNPAARSGALTGVALGIGVTWRAVSIDAALSRAVRAPSSRMREGTLVGVRVSCSL
ncbi:hemolysin activation/secretion protein [Cupriavidus plantarum]|uniref:Hemolysin activation/secretion protein n=2 Tax=Cupriavidus plantarum TaxID=942865 RepID=A0A316F4A6_9BURK|nr:hemolysin activation/secretion protein [Cupriavidus plantarum]